MGGGVGLDRLSLNQATVKHLGLEEAVALCVRHDIPAVGLWRDRVAETGLAEAAAAVRAAGLQVSSLCRGGFFTRADPGGRRAARSDNLAALAEAAELGTDTLVLVCGGLVPGQRDLGLARRMVADAIGELVPYAQRLGVRLGIEALHPMFCADRCVISSLGEAVDLALRFPPTPSAWWWTPTTSGGTRGWRMRSPGPGGGSSASRCATGCCRCRRTPCSAAATSATG